MGLFRIFDIAGSAMSAQSVRLNTTASNLANANTVSGSAEARTDPVNRCFRRSCRPQAVPVRQAIQPVPVFAWPASSKPAHHQPRFTNQAIPLADADGYIYMSNVNPVDELVNMISASRSYQNSVEVLSTSKNCCSEPFRSVSKALVIQDMDSFKE
ncbi:MAG: flagellar basal body rod protein FlgC [Gammaproteobacteria bacterium]